MKSNHYMAAECGGLGAKCRVFTEDPFGTSCTELDLTGYSLEKTVESLLNRAEGTRQDAEEALSFYNRTWLDAIQRQSALCPSNSSQWLVANWY